jgi:acyl-coenzyme A thioesterase PaaI-like protein
VGLTVNFLAPAAATDLTADARVVRRGGVTVIAVDVSNQGGEQVATALVTYRL